MQEKKTPKVKAPPKPRDERHEPLPTWRNTRPRGNPETDQHDLARGRERLETVLGR